MAQRGGDGPMGRGHSSSEETVPLPPKAAVLTPEPSSAGGGDLSAGGELWARVGCWGQEEPSKGRGCPAVLLLSPGPGRLFLMWHLALGALPTRPESKPRGQPPSPGLFSIREARG